MTNKQKIDKNLDLKVRVVGKKTIVSYKGSSWTTFSKLTIGLLNNISDFLSGGRKEELKDRKVKPKDIKEKI